MANGQSFAVDGFECQLDNGPIERCDNQLKTYTGILPGPHTFKVNYIIIPEEGPPIRDLTPATRTWDIIPDTVIDSADRWRW